MTLLDGDDTDHRAARANFGPAWVQGKGASLPSCHRLTRRSVDAWLGFGDELARRFGTVLAFERNGSLAFCLSVAEFEERRSQLHRLHNAAGGEQDWEMIDRSALGRMLPGVRLGPVVVGASYGRSVMTVGAAMGSCQGRQCGCTVTRLRADASGRPPGEIGLHRVRPPLKPVTVGELATPGAPAPVPA